MVWLLYSPFSAKCLDAESVLVTHCHYCVYFLGSLFMHRYCLLCAVITTNSHFPVSLQWLSSVIALSAAIRFTNSAILLLKAFLASCSYSLLCDKFLFFSQP